MAIDDARCGTGLAAWADTFTPPESMPQPIPTAFPTLPTILDQGTGERHCSRCARGGDQAARLKPSLGKVQVWRSPLSPLSPSSSRPAAWGKSLRFIGFLEL